MASRRSPVSPLCSEEADRVASFLHETRSSDDLIGGIAVEIQRFDRTADMRVIFDQIVYE
jgi:hypothetical protein